MSLKLTAELKTHALNLGFDDCGVASAIDTPSSTHFLEYIRQRRHGPLDYLEKTANERSDARRMINDACSVFIVVKNYYTGDHQDFHSPDEIASGAKVARYAWGRDYHSWFKKRLRKLRTFLTSQREDAEVLIFNDMGPFLERAWAEKAGLGFIGKSSMFIHRQYGTWTLLGGFLTNIELESEEKAPMPSCGSCTACINACPTNAIIEPKKIDARRCISTWTIEKPLHQGAEEKKFHGHGWGFGCDICQEVCPWNKFSQKTKDSHFQPAIEQVILQRDHMKETLAGTPLARAGKKGLMLNIARATSTAKMGTKS